MSKYFYKKYCYSVNTIELDKLETISLHSRNSSAFSSSCKLRTTERSGKREERIEQKYIENRTG